MSAKLSRCLPSRCGGAVFHDLPVPGCALARKLRLQSYECKATAAARLQWHGCSATVLRLQSYDCSAMIPSCRRCLWCCILYWCYDPALSADTSFTEGLYRKTILMGLIHVMGGSPSCRGDAVASTGYTLPLHSY